jgi:hypothetical protein
MPASIQARLHSRLVGCLLGGLRAANLLGLLVALGHNALVADSSFRRRSP